MRLSDIGYEIHSNGKTIVLTALIMLFVFFGVSVMVFFIALSSAEKEQVMVPNVVGKDLPEALLELQAKELYPQLQLRYSEKSVEKGTVLEQDPAPGSIVKGGKRISLVVSQGVVIDTVQNYIGEHITAVQKEITETTAANGGKYLQIRLPYITKNSEEPAGTILEQKPQPGQPIAHNTELIFVISKGSSTQKTAVPDLQNQSLSAIYKIMSRTALIFAFTEDKTNNDAAEKISVTAQEPAPDFTLKAFSPVAISLAIPKTGQNGTVCGILQTTLPDFPYPFTVSLNAAYQNGTQEQLVSFKHPGGACTIPYRVPQGTRLSVHAAELNTEVYTTTAEQ